MKDWLLIVISLTISGIVMFLLLLETTISHLRGSVVLDRDSEHLFGRDVSALDIINDVHIIYSYTQIDLYPFMVHYYNIIAP